MANNVINAVFSSSNITYTKPAYQYDYGMILQFSGIELPQAYEVHFSNTEFCGESISQIGDETGVTIPDEMFLNGNPIYAWTYLHTGEDDGETVYKAVISVNKRAKPSDLEPTPVQQDAITQAIAALNVAVEQTAQDVISAGESAQAASDAADVAVEAKDQAIDAKESAEDAQEAAETAQGKAEDAQRAAEAAAGSVLGLTADATVDANVGTPSVEVEVTTESDHKNMSFTFRNLKGVQGDPGVPGVGISSVVLNSDYTLTITLTNETSYTTSSIRGEVGATPNLTIGTVTTLPEGSQATATITGTDEDPVLNLGIPVGDTGDPGVSPTVTVTEITGGHNVEITDAQGTTDFDVLDGEITEDALEERLIDKADVITSTASGEIVTIADGMKDAPVLDLSVSLLPVQDLHGQDAPYPPGGWKNLLNPSEREDLTNNIHFYFTNGFLFKANQAYTFSVSQAAAQLTISKYDGTGNLSIKYSNTAISYTPTEDVLVRFDVYYSASYPAPSGGTSAVNCQLELGSSASAYAPYSNVCPISGWTGVKINKDDSIVFPPDTAIVQGTVNGNTGAGTTTNARIRCSYFSIEPNTTYTAYSNLPYIGARFFSSNEQSGIISDDSIDLTADSITFTTGSTTKYARLIFAKATPSSGSSSVDVAPSDLEYVNVISERGEIIPIDWSSSAGTVYGGSLDVTSGVLTVTDAQIASYSGETLPSTWISDRDAYAPGTTPTTGAQVVYKLATPTTYQLTPVQIQTLLGTNNFWSNSNGSLDLEYRCDTKLYIEQLTKPTEDDMTANQNITSGSFFMVGSNALFLATTAIGQGEKIVEGTNCTRLSLADALNSLNS